MSRSDGLCDYCDPPKPATKAIFAKGYPAAQEITCDEHVQAHIEKDMRFPGSTMAFDVLPIEQGQTRAVPGLGWTSALPGSGMV